MAKPHRRAGAAITVTTTLSSEQLAALCKEAADQSKARLDEAKPGELSFSLRGALAPTRIHIMSFKVRLNEADDGQRALVSRITHYKTRQSRFLFIPAGPKQMLGLKTYERFMQRLSELSRHADPNATVAIDG